MMSPSAHSYKCTAGIDPSCIPERMRVCRFLLDAPFVRAQVRVSFLLPSFSLAPNSSPAHAPVSHRNRFLTRIFLSSRISRSRTELDRSPYFLRYPFLSLSLSFSSSVCRNQNSDRLRFLATHLNRQFSLFLSCSFIRLAVIPYTSTADDFLMAALATTDEVASSLCSCDVRWGIRIASTANPTARPGPTVCPSCMLRAVACARAAAQLRPEYGVTLGLSACAQRLSNRPLIPNWCAKCRESRATPRHENRTLSAYHLYIIQQCCTCKTPLLLLRSPPCKQRRAG